MKKLVILFLVLFLSVPAFGAADWADKLELGGSTQLRWYKLNNIWDCNDKNDADNWETFRLHTKINAKATVSDDISGFIQLANQTWGNGVTPGNDMDNAGNKIFVDNAYLTVKDFFGSNFIFQAGRMDLMYGSGFVLFDGNSQFGSTNLYFDGVKLSMPLGEKSMLDALYFMDEENNMSNEPVTTPPALGGDDITLGGLYLTAHCPVMGSEKGAQEIYTLNRRDERLNKDIWMAGLRLSDKFAMGFDYSAEAAYQMGDFNEQANIDQEALGCKLDAGYTFTEAMMTPRIFCGYMFMEGDDPDTDEMERWDMFYGGWPQWGDLLAWKYLNRGAGNNISDYDPTYNQGSTVANEAVYSNISMPSIGVGASLTEQLSAKLTYGMLTVDEPVAGADDDFGDYYQLQASYGYSKNLSFSVYTAMIDPGDAFKTDDKPYEVLIETKLKF
ncbi:MAG: alginate export family protein [Desulfosalsimonadaceae bacterium]|nr:alginate export family protein [Desulfosalsimonadaceae bacterium]